MILTEFSSGSAAEIVRFVVFVALTSSRPCATKVCEAPALPANAKLYHQSVHKSNYTNGEKLRYRCLPGFAQRGFSIFRECRQGKWTSDGGFMCLKAKTCGSPGIVRNGIKRGSSYSLGEKVWYSCNAGYILHGRNVRICRQNMTWSGRKPRCKAIDCGPLAIPSNAKKVLDTGSSWKGKVVFKCTKRRYVLSGTRIRTCQSNERWSGTTTYCRAPCSNPGSPKGGTKTGRNHRHGGKISFRCPSTHRLQGDKTTKCFDGKWISKVPSCAIRGSDKDFTECGIINARRQRRLTGSAHSVFGGWPWQVGLYRSQVNGSDTFLCGGALISNRWVVTAAHCFLHHTGDLFVTAGDHNVSHNESTEQKVKAVKIIIHPSYKDGLFENDIALVKLHRSVELNGHVRLICLPRKRRNGTTEDLAEHGNSGFVAGWGATQVLGLGKEPSDDSRISQVLRHSSFKVQDNALCRNTTSYSFNSSVAFCAGSENEGVGICKGDSGGPFVVEVNRVGRKRWVSAGLVSWSEGCGLVGRFDYYTRLAPYMVWINQITKRRPTKEAKGEDKSD